MFRQSFAAPALRLAIATLGFFSLASLSIIMIRYDGGVAMIWAASAALIAQLLVTPRRQRPAVTLAGAFGSLLATGLVGAGWVPGLLLTLVYTGEAWLIARLLDSRRSGGAFADDLAGTVRFVLIAGVAVPSFAGLGGSLVIAQIAGAPYWPVWMHWVAGHGLANIALIPLFVAIGRRPTRSSSVGLSERRFMLPLLLIIMAATCVLVFFVAGIPLLFLPLVPLMIATIGAGRNGAAGSVALLALLGGGATLAGQGPIATMAGSAALKAQYFQFYLACAALLGLAVSALLNKRIRLIAQLRASEALFRSLAENSSDAVLEIGADGIIRYASPAVKEITGYPASHYVGRHSFEFIDPQDVAKVQAVHLKALEQPGLSFAVEYRPQVARHGIRWFEAMTRAVIGADGTPTGVVTGVRDVTRRKALQQWLEDAVDRDDLTGTLNRPAFRRAVEQEVAQREGRTDGMAIALIDFDHFKAVNDTHGHHTGDEVLRSFGRIVEHLLGARVTIGRMGGEEFALLFHDCTASEAEAMCEALLHAIRTTPVRVDDTVTLKVTASAGLVVIDGPRPIDQLIWSADEALYASKKGGRNRLTVAKAA